MVASLGLRESSLRMVKDGTTLPVASYTTAPGSRSRATERFVNAAGVYERYIDGATIVLEGLQRYWEPLTFFCRDLELALGHRLQVNAYITPPGAQGFAAHRDDHDVFVLQVAGAKQWSVFDSIDDQAVVIDRELRPGDVLYIPKGFPHAATTTESSSAHLTVGVITHDVGEVVRAILKHIEEEASFSDRLVGEAARNKAALRAEVERVAGDLRLWLDKLDVDAVVDSLARRYVSTSQPILRGQLRQLELLDQISDDTVIRHRRGATCVLDASGDRMHVLLSDRELTMPLVAQAAMELIAARASFHVQELVPSIDRDSAIVLVRRLVREGFLEVVV